jgi:N-acetylneuraminic acid mutarotase
MTSGPVLSSIIIIIIVMVVVNTTLNLSASLATQSSSTHSSTTTSSTITSAATSKILAWSPSVSYPTNIWTQSCVASGGDIYCVGGLSGSSTVTDVASAVYYASISSSGVGQWTSTTSYPFGIRAESCVTSGGEIYCVGGYASSFLSNAVYYAPLSSSGVGRWTSTTSYPAPIWTHSCAASGIGIYCVGGITPSENFSSTVYYAPFSSSGIGKWTSTTSYPVGDRQLSCAASSSDLYCVGGYQSTDVYYAPLSSSGLGQWTKTTSYPFTVGANSASCVILGGEIYCVGGHTGPTISNAVNHATISSSGVGQWTNATSYPVGVWGESCVTSGGEIYCVGGQTPSGSITNSVSFSDAF